MALTIGASGSSGGGGGILYNSTRKTSSAHLSLRRPILIRPNHPSGLILSLSPRTSHIAAAKKFSSRTGRFDSKNKRSSTTTTKEQEEEQQRTAQIETGDSNGSTGAFDEIDDGYFLPELPGDKPDFWEGTQWDAFGFFVQYMWAFGIAFALIACGVAVATYNEGATDFKKTPVYKESIQSRELLEEPEGSNSDVFEFNPTEEAPSLE